VKSRLAILLWSPGPEAGDLCAAPFYYAAAAGAMDVEVEVHFAGRSVLLLVEGAAESLPSAPGSELSVLHFMREARRFGARFLACSQALDARAVDRARLIAEVDGVAGATVFAARALDPDWATLVF